MSIDNFVPIELLFILRVGISRFICKENSFDSVIGTKKGAFLVYFTFLLVVKARIKLQSFKISFINKSINNNERLNLSNSSVHETTSAIYS